MNWTGELIEQLDFYWEHSLMPRLAGLTDDEYLWEPVEGCWTIRPQADGAGMIDWAFSAPEPPPFTTIAWRMAHISILIFGIRASSHFGDGSLGVGTAEWPLTAAEGLASLRRHHAEWRDGLATLDDESMRVPVGEAEGPWAEYPMATLVLHLNREVFHHSGEIALLRDLYRAGFQRG